MTASHALFAQTQFARLVSHFSLRGCKFSLIAHPPLGETVAASRARGHSLACSAKTIIVCLRQTSRADASFALLVVPGDCRVDFGKAKTVLGCKKLAFASTGDAERLMCCVSGTIPPVSLDGALKVVMDTRLQRQEFVVFNASLLDVSMKIETSDYLRVVHPLLADISTPVAIDPLPQTSFAEHAPPCLNRHS